MPEETNKSVRKDNLAEYKREILAVRHDFNEAFDNKT